MKKWIALLVLAVFLPALLVLYASVEILLDDKDRNLDLDRTFKDTDGKMSQSGAGLDRVYTAGLPRNGQHEFNVLLHQKNKHSKSEQIPKPRVGLGEHGKYRGDIVHKWNMGDGRDVEQLRKNADEEYKANNDYITFPPFIDSIDPSGPGQMGHPVVVNASLLQAEEKAQYDEGWKRNSFNQYVSDRISVHRSLPHGWSEDCKEAATHFRTQLPKASVIIIFHNEAWSILLRSVHSVLSRTPENLLREVILVDDNSTHEYLKTALETYWRVKDPRVKVIHAAKREGLTRARLLGYQAATSPVLVFLDSHIECFPGWYEPLADRIATNSNITVFPSIEAIDPVTLRVVLNHEVDSVGLFRWRDMTFQWHAVPKDYREQITSYAQPLRSPTMPGGLFAISREFFTLLGTYDPGLDYWGGENVELSFKAWMCYGSVELIPCSHVGHIFRRSNPITWPTELGVKNVARVAEVWMDDYKNYFLEYNLYNVRDYGDVSERRQLRQRLGCRTFDWYMRNVKPLQIPPMHVLHAGELRNVGAKLCMDSYAPDGDRPKLYGCHGMGGNQFWYVSKDELMFQDEKRVCHKDGEVMLDTDCRDTWSITQDNQLVHRKTGLCLQGGLESPGAAQPDLSVTLKQCDLDNKRQSWTFQPRRSDLHFPALD